MRTNVERVFAAGDVATFPLSDSGLRAKVQHWSMAHSQGRNAQVGLGGRAVAVRRGRFVFVGRIAALNMMSSGHLEPLRSVPYFWTTIFGKSIRYAGTLTAKAFELNYIGYWMAQVSLQDIVIILTM